MNTTNIIGAALLGWLLILGVQEKTPQTQPKQQIVYVRVPLESEGCGCDVCQSCSCAQAKSCSECDSPTDEKEVAVDTTASNFPRPRKPCPGGPGRR